MIGGGLFKMAFRKERLSSAPDSHAPDQHGGYPGRAYPRRGEGGAAWGGHRLVWRLSRALVQAQRPPQLGGFWFVAGARPTGCRSGLLPDE